MKRSGAPREPFNQGSAVTIARPLATALHRGPFLAISVGSVLLDDRFSGRGIGGGAGGYLGPLRIAVDFLYMPATSDVDLNANIGGRKGTLVSPLPAWLFAGSVGYAIQPRPTFVLSPGVRYMTTELPAHGHAMVAVVPLEWIWTSGLRVVLEGGVGYAFGGEVRVAQCQTGQLCTDVISERDGGIVLQVRFGCGFGF